MKQVNFWSDNFQNQIPFSTPKKVSPGEQVSVTCVYDTTKRPDTEFGLQTVNEMCMNFLGYYPVQRDPVTGHEINLCAFALFQGQTFTICGDGAQELALNTSVLNLRNPSFEDMQGANTTFPTEPDVCEVGTGATPSDEPGPAVSGSPETTREPVGVVPGGSPDPEESSIPGGGGLEGESESAEPSAEDDNVCFPASATVSLRGGMTKRMEDIVIGDEVLVSADTYSTVFMFTHRSAGVAYTFVRLSCDGGVKLSLTAGHFLYVNGALSMAGDVQVGDTVTLGEGGTRVVRQKAYVREKGLYNPQTLHGDIVVDGVVASTYTKSIMPDMAHGLLTPLRWVWWIGGVDVSSPFV